MNQPLQAIIGNVELLTQFQLEDGAVSKIEKIFSEMERIKNINSKLMNLTHDRTKPYPSTNILDVERSAGQDYGFSSNTFRTTWANSFMTTGFIKYSRIPISLAPAASMFSLKPEHRMMGMSGRKSIN